MKWVLLLNLILQEGGENLETLSKVQEKTSILTLHFSGTTAVLYNVEG